MPNSLKRRQKRFWRVVLEERNLFSRTRQDFTSTPIRKHKPHPTDGPSPEKTSHHFCRGEVRENRGRTHPHTINTFLFQHEKLRGSKCPHLPQDEPKNDSTKSKEQKTVQGVSLRYAPVVGSLLRRSLRFDFRKTGDVIYFA